jgi:aspartyl-tRNA(Asn)/glutamyl-tRNA(Gln) amidotransferase subunit A
MRYGLRVEGGTLADTYKRTRAAGFGAEVRRRIMIGTYVLSAGYYDAYYLKAQKVRQLIADDFRTAFESCDLIVSPTAPGTAFRLGEKADDPVSMYLQDIYTIAVNLAGLPGISIPAPLSGGMPVGLQLIGNYFDEARLLNAAHQLQLVTDWHRQKPEGFLEC